MTGPALPTLPARAKGSYSSPAHGRPALAAHEGRPGAKAQPVSLVTRLSWPSPGALATALGLTLEFGHASESRLEGRVLLLAQRFRMAFLDRAHDRGSSLHLEQAPFCGADQFGAAVHRVGLAFDIPQAFEIVDESADDLLVLPGGAGEFAGTDAVGAQVGEDCSRRGELCRRSPARRA